MINFDELFIKRANQIKPGLERIQRSYSFLKQPAVSIPSVLIGGTNGKGSTSGFLWSLLSVNTKKVGLYSSPHLLSFAERFQISGQAPDEQRVADTWEELKKDLPQELYEELSFFELATLIAFRLFARTGVEAQVLEVGLGGRWDATNISDPALSVLVSVSRDHEEFLGRDVLGILREKLGILRPGRPFLWGHAGEVLECPGYQEVLEAELARHACPLIMAGRDFGREGDQLFFKLPGAAPFHLPLSPELQNLAPYLIQNLTLAAAAYEVLRATCVPLSLMPLSQIWSIWQSGETISAPVTLLGRCQKIKASPRLQGQELCIDVCHNPDGARRFVEAWRPIAQGRKVPALISILRDKDFNAILDILRPHFGPLVLYRSTSERAWLERDRAERHRDLRFCESLSEAWGVLSQTEGCAKVPWVACGSVFAIGQLLQFVDVLPQDVSLARVLRGDWS